MTIQEILDRLTLPEKAVLLQGATVWKTHAVERLGIPSIFLADGPHGLRRQAGESDHLGLFPSLEATCFPTAATMANSWDISLGEELGAALGEEALVQGVQVLLGPGLNIKRSPLCGRNFEYFSEDPYLAGKMAAAYIRGIQSQGVSACPKHFAANSQELRRMAMDSVVDERTLREIYLTGFEIAVKEGDPKSLMTSYNMVNGVYANENKHLLRDILRKEWGFQGFAVTDWGGDNDHAAGVKAGSSLVMPAPGLTAAAELVAQVEAGKVKESVLDDRLTELLCVVFATHAAAQDAPQDFDKEKHHALAEKCAAESIVLLENDGILPLKNRARVGVIGRFAHEPRYQGAGSSRVNPTRVDTLLDALEAGPLFVAGYAPGFQENGRVKAELLADAEAIARSADTVFLCLGLTDAAEVEGIDRDSLSLPADQLTLFHAVKAVNPNIVLVLSGGAPFLIPQGARAVIHGYLSGQAGAKAMADALVGKVNPSGHLAETWPLALTDTPCYPYYPSPERTSEYREGIFVGYRYYETAEIPVKYPFGYGLSYTTFRYSDLTADSRSVTFTAENTGSIAGACVPQVYVSFTGNSQPRAKKELKGFCKLFLEPGEKKTVTVPLDDKAFRYFNTETGRFETESGNYDISLGSHVRNTPLTVRVRLMGRDVPPPEKQLPHYMGKPDIHCVPDAEFDALLGRPAPNGHWDRHMEKNDPICRLHTCRGLTMRLVGKVHKWYVERQLKQGKVGTDMLYVYNMPLRSLANMTAGIITHEMVEDVLGMCNGWFLPNFARFIAHYFKARKLEKEFQSKLKAE